MNISERDRYIVALIQKILDDQCQSTGIEFIPEENWSYFEAQLENQIIYAVRNALEESNLEQDELALKAGIPSAQLERILTNENEKITLEIIAKLANALDMRPEINFLKNNEQLIKKES